MATVPQLSVAAPSTDREVEKVKAEDRMRTAPPPQRVRAALRSADTMPFRRAPNPVRQHVDLQIRSAEIENKTEQGRLEAEEAASLIKDLKAFVEEVNPDRQKERRRGLAQKIERTLQMLKQKQADLQAAKAPIAKPGAEKLPAARPRIPEAPTPGRSLPLPEILNRLKFTFQEDPTDEPIPETTSPIDAEDAEEDYANADSAFFSQIRVLEQNNRRVDKLRTQTEPLLTQAVTEIAQLTPAARSDPARRNRTTQILDTTLKQLNENHQALKHLQEYHKTDQEAYAAVEDAPPPPTVTEAEMLAADLADRTFGNVSEVQESVPPEIVAELLF